jgi:predicted deacylase
VFQAIVRGVIPAGVALGLAGACATGSGTNGAPSDTPKAVTAVTDPGSPMVHILSSDRPGPTVTLIAGVHGGKRSAVRALEHLAVTLPGTLLRGTVLLVPTAHEAAARSDLAQLSPLDSLNLNRVFPGRIDGRPTERLAHRLMVDLVAQSDFLIDLHGADGEEMVGRFAYAAHPGLDPRVDSAALRLATLWGVPRVVWDTAGPRTVATSRFLQTAAHLSGVPAITVFEAGTAREEPEAIAAFERGARRTLAGLGLLPEETGDVAAPIVHSRREVALAERPGAWEPARWPGDPVGPGELLGTRTDSSGTRHDVRATTAGTVLHIRLAGPVSAGASLAILAVAP